MLAERSGHDQGAPGWAPGSARAAAIGAALALCVYALPLTRFVFGYFAILVHEAGHAVLAWAMGYPAVPALDLFEGGGVSLQFERSPLLVAVMLALGVSLVVLVRRTSWLLPAVALAALHALLLAFPFHEAVIVAAGHGAELLVAALLVRRGLLGDTLGAERIATFATAVFVLLLNADLALGLVFDRAALERYAATRKGDAAMDLARLAEALGWGIDAVAAVLLIAALLVAPVAALSARSRRQG